jgi:hypothetical protein
MNSILRHTGVAALVLGLLGAPAFAQGAGGAGAATDANGATGINGTANGSDMSHSSAELPNNDAGTPINNGPNGTGTSNLRDNPSANPPANGMPHAMIPGSATSGQ